MAALPANPARRPDIAFLPGGLRVLRMLAIPRSYPPRPIRRTTRAVHGRQDSMGLAWPTAF
jgi:hypothetical protein